MHALAALLPLLAAVAMGQSETFPLAQGKSFCYFSPLEGAWSLEAYPTVDLPKVIKPANERNTEYVSLLLLFFRNLVLLLHSWFLSSLSDLLVLYPTR
jgi:hypothetical protein